MAIVYMSLYNDAMTQTVTLSEVATFIGGASQHDIEIIFELARARTIANRQLAASEMLSTLQVGDRVKIGHGISPKYLTGETGTVVGLGGGRPGSVSVKLDYNVRKYDRSYPIGVPASVLVKVEEKAS